MSRENDKISITSSTMVDEICLNFVFGFCSNVLKRFGDFGDYLEVMKVCVNHPYRAEVTVIFINPFNSRDKIEKTIRLDIPSPDQFSTKRTKIFLNSGTELIYKATREFDLVFDNLRRKTEQFEMFKNTILILNEEQILYILRQDKKMWDILNAAYNLAFPWVIGAGTIRNRVWNYLSKKEDDPKTQPNDIDLIFFNPNVTEEYFDKEIEKTLNRYLEANWSAKNQARIHVENGDQPYKHMEDAMRYWPETCTAVGVTLENGILKLIAPHGIADLVNFIARPSSNYKIAHPNLEKFKERLVSKKWQEKWPQIKIIM